MAGSVNKVILIGNIGSDPEIRRMASGDAVATFSLATSESWTDKGSGERKERIEWHKVVIFNEGLVKIVEQYVKKGSKLYIEGQLQTRKWQDRDGHDRYTTEIVLQNYRGNLTLLDSRRTGGQENYNQPYPPLAETPRYPSSPSGNSFRDNKPTPFDDEIPF